MSSQRTALRSHDTSLSGQSQRDHRGACVHRPNWVFDSLVRRTNSPIARGQAGLLSCRMRCQVLNKADLCPPLPLPGHYPLSFV